MTELTLELLRQELVPIHSELATLRIEMSARFDGLYVALEGMRRDARMTNAAVNEFASTNVTTGEIEALHNDVDRLQTEMLDVKARLTTIERLRENKP